MRFKDVEFYGKVKVDEDALGNPIYDEALIGTYPVTLTQWTTEEIALLDRNVTQTMRKMVTKASVDVLKQTTHVYIDDVKYGDVDVKSDFVRWRLCHVKEYFT